MQWMASDVTDRAALAIEPRAFRDALGTFATGVTLVTTLDRQQRPIAVTVNSFNSVSLEPPLVLFSLARTSSSFEDFVAAGRFAVNVLAANQQHLSTMYARPGISRMEETEHAIGGFGCPLIVGALAHLECRTMSTHHGGDHLIFLGEVQSISSREDGEPLLYYRGRYGQVASCSES